MGDPKQNLIADWLLKADHDIGSAERLMQPEPILDTAVYHCQQAVEKTLKGSWRHTMFLYRKHTTSLF